MRVAVVGAGWSGLAAATFLRERGVDADVYEAGERVGGRIATTREQGYLLEHGPHALASGVEASERLVRAAGVAMAEAPARARRYVVHDGRVEPLPASPPAILQTRLLTPAAKLRLLAEPFQAPGDADETVARFLERRLGPRVRHLGDAFVTGVYAGDPERLLVRHAFPHLARRDVEGGILRGLRKTGPPGRLHAPREGMQAWMERLAAPLGVRLRTRVARVRETGAGVMVATEDGAEATYDAALVAVDPPAAARILGVHAAPPPMAPVAVVGFGAPAEAAPLPGYGVLVPEGEFRFSLGVLFESRLFPHRAPEGAHLLRVLVGGRRHPERADLPPVELARRAWEDLLGLGIVRGAPLWTRVLPPVGIPQPESGHDAWLAALPRGRVRVLGIGQRAVGLNPLAEEAWRTVAELVPSPG